MSETEKSFEGLYDLMLRTNLCMIAVKNCLSFSRKGNPKTIDNLVLYADQFKEARVTSAISLTSQRTSKPPREGYTKPEYPSPTVGSRFPDQRRNGPPSHNTNEKRCYHCGNRGHIAKECFSKQSRVGSVDPKYNLTPNVSRNDRDYSQSNGSYKNCGACTLRTDSVLDVISKSPISSQTVSVVSCPPNLPVKEGRVGNHIVQVLRDTGCSGVVVRKELVSKNQFTGEEQDCVLADGSVVKVPLANVFIDSPFCWRMVSVVYGKSNTRRLNRKY